MRGSVSPGTGQRYPLTMICAVFHVPRSTVYRAMTPAVSAPVVAAKRGPKTRWSDAEVVAAIRAVLAATPFHGEGYRTVRARLAHRGSGHRRDARLAGDAGASPACPAARLGPPNGDPAHAGTITTTRPDEMWGHRRDALLPRGGRLVLVLRRHRSLCRRARRLAHGQARRSLGRARAAASERAPGVRPLREGRRARAPDPLRDWRPQYIADAWINEVKWLGMTITPSYVGEPECHGVIEASCAR
jgi:putative transposase